MKKKSRIAKIKKSNSHLKCKEHFKRGISILLLLGLLGGGALLVMNAWVYEVASRYVLTEEEAAEMKVDCILVLGAGVRSNTPTRMLQDRLDCGIALYKAGISNRMIMSGDHGHENYDEVNVMKTYAKEANVKANDVFMDHAGFSTYESMYRAKEVFEVKTVIVVTQQYHLYRAIFDARRLGLEAYGVIAHEFDYPIRYDVFNNVRESLARCKDFIWCIIKPEPTFLGEAIPISADGSLTDDLV